MKPRSRRYFDSQPQPVIDVTRLVARLMRGRLPTGVDRVCLTYVQAYANSARAALHRGPFNLILPAAASRELFALLLAPPRNLTRRIVALVAKAALFAWRDRSCAGSMLLNIGHSGPEQPQYVAWLRRRGLRPVFMIHDVIPVTHPEYCRPPERQRHMRRLDAVLRTASAVITNSGATLRALSEYARSRGLAMPPTIAAPLAASAFSADSEQRPLAEPYFVMLSTIEPRKNHWMILQVWRRLVEMHRVLLSARQPSQGEPTPEDVTLHPSGVGRALRDLRRTSAPGVTLPARVFACGFSLNKLRMLRRFAGDSTVHSVRNTGRIPSGSTLLLWGSTPPPPGLAADVALIRVEDGFLRSVGLGAELARPLSWVLDRTGMYYDATRPSDLEQLLQSWEFTPQLLARAAALRERIVASGITKYSVGERAWRRPGRARVILVPGQVESDASLRLGARSLHTNLALVRAVREANPDACLVYKPHPDVAAGLRARGKDEQQVRDWCDEVVTDVAMGALLEQVDEVHVLTSLAGFEALLRGKLVVCYGLPFYAGWGLTQDVEPVPRRRRRLSVNELVAGTLIAYPTYVSRRTGRYISPEPALDELLAWREAAGRPNRAWQELRRAVLRLTVARP